ncbi:hypothetical protein ACFL5V_13390 [Fibrobacterota bacterium]
MSSVWNGGVYHNSEIATEAGNVFAGSRSLQFRSPQQAEGLGNGVGMELSESEELDILFLRYYTKFDAGFDISGSSHNGGGMSAHYFENHIRTGLVVLLRTDGGGQHPRPAGRQRPGWEIRRRRSISGKSPYGRGYHDDVNAGDKMIPLYALTCKTTGRFFLHEILLKKYRPIYASQAS